MVSFRLTDRIQGLILIGTHGDLCHIDVTIAHGDGSQILLLDVLTACSKLCHRADRCCLGSLTARIGINLGVDAEDIDILAGSKHMIHTAKADIVAPAVTTDNPL